MINRESMINGGEGTTPTVGGVPRADSIQTDLDTIAYAEFP